VFHFLYERWDKLRDDDNYADKYESLVEGFRLESRAATMYYAFFLLRKLSLAMILLFFPDNTGLQVICLSINSTLMIIYVISVFTNKSKSLNYIKMLNKETVKVLELFIIIFSDFNPQPVLKQKW
jgi:hypothetical protein